MFSHWPLSNTSTALASYISIAEIGTGGGRPWPSFSSAYFSTTTSVLSVPPLPWQDRWAITGAPPIPQIKCGMSGGTTSRQHWPGHRKRYNPTLGIAGHHDDEHLVDDLARKKRSRSDCLPVRIGR